MKFQIVLIVSPICQIKKFFVKDILSGYAAASDELIIWLLKGQSFFIKEILIVYQFIFNLSIYLFFEFRLLLVV